MKQTTIKDIQKEEIEFLGKKLKHKDHKHQLALYDSMKADLMTATPYWEWIRGSAYATFATWDCECCKPIESMKLKEMEAKLLYMLKSRPISVAVESAKFTFRLTGISRAMTHQLVRHRGMAFGQQSLRVSNPGYDPIRIPQWFASEEGGMELYVRTDKAMVGLKDLYFDLVKAGCPPEQARLVLPIGITTKIVVTMTLRDMIAYFKARTSSIAQGEHEYMANLMMDEMKALQPEYWKFIKGQLGNGK